MVKVLYVISTLKRTGPTNVLFNLISALDRSNFEPIVLTLSNEDPRFPSLNEDFKSLGIDVFSLALTRFSGFLTGRKKLKDFVHRKNFDVIHINGLRGDMLVKISDYPNVQHIVTTINSNIYDDYTMLYGKLKGRIMATIHMNSIKGKVAIGCSNFVVSELNKKYKSSLKAIYNGIPKDRYLIPSYDEKKKIRQELGLNLETKIFVFVGYLIYRKNPLTTIKGFLNATLKNDATLLMIGDGPLMDDCKRFAKADVNKKIIWLGNQPETLKYLKASDYYIASSYSEGLPTSVMEAMACGLPVILSNIAPHFELTQEISSWQYLFEVDNENMLSEKIENICKDDYKKLSEQCRSVIDEKINSKIMTKAYEQIYIGK